MFVIWLNKYLIDKSSGWCSSKDSDLLDQDAIFMRYAEDEIDVSFLQDLYPLSENDRNLAEMIFGVDKVKIFEDNYPVIVKTRDGLI